MVHARRSDNARLKKTAPLFRAVGVRIVESGNTFVRDLHAAQQHFGAAIELRGDDARVVPWQGALDEVRRSPRLLDGDAVEAAVIVFDVQGSTWWTRHELNRDGAPWRDARAIIAGRKCDGHTAIATLRDDHPGVGMRCVVDDDVMRIASGIDWNLDDHRIGGRRWQACVHRDEFMGIDRLLMNLTGLNIRETILFPLVKPE